MSTLKVDALQTTGGAGLYPAKAWAVYDLYTSLTLHSSGNVSSVSDLGTGKARVSFSNSFSDANYATSGCIGGGGGTTSGGGALCYDNSPSTLPTTSSADLDSFIAGVGSRDLNYNSATFLR